MSDGPAGRTRELRHAGQGFRGASDRPAAEIIDQLAAGARAAQAPQAR